MLRLLPLALLPLLIALPARADAAATCGVPAAHAVYETPEVQVFQKNAKLVACYRPTGRQRVVGTFADDRMGTDEGHPGFTGVLNVAGGKRRELESPGPVATNCWTLIAGGEAGLRAWPDDVAHARVVAPGPVSEAAISDGLEANVAYWLDAAGNPQSAAI